MPALTVVADSGISVAQIWCAPSTVIVCAPPLPPKVVLVLIPAVSSPVAASPTPRVGVDSA